MPANRIHLGTRWEVEPGVVDIARRRTQFLLHPSHQTTTPLQQLLANAYLQGMADAAEAISTKAEASE